MEITGFVSLKHLLCSKPGAQQWCWQFRSISPRTGWVSGSHPTTINEDTESKGGFTEIRHWGSFQYFLGKGGCERNPKHVFEVKFPICKNINQKDARFFYFSAEHRSHLCRFPHPAKQPQVLADRKTALLRWKWSLPDSLSSAPQLRNVPLAHESPNGFNKWQPSKSLHGQPSVAISARQMRRPQGGSALGGFPSPGSFGVNQLKTWRFDCSKSEEEGKCVQHGNTSKRDHTIMGETLKSEQMQTTSCCRTRRCSLLHCHTAYILKFQGWAH